MVGLRMPPDMREELEKAAAAGDLTLSKKILQVLERHLLKKGKGQ